MLYITFIFWFTELFAELAAAFDLFLTYPPAPET